jgi:hypothetical protein
MNSFRDRDRIQHANWITKGGLWFSRLTNKKILDMEEGRTTLKAITQKLSTAELADFELSKDGDISGDRCDLIDSIRSFIYKYSYSANKALEANS